MKARLHLKCFQCDLLMHVSILVFAQYPQIFAASSKSRVENDLRQLSITRLFPRVWRIIDMPYFNPSPPHLNDAEVQLCILQYVDITAKQH
jgi:hypothetical protein